MNKIKNFCFLKNCFNNFHKILWVYSTFERQQYDTIGYSRKILETKKNYFFIFYPSPSVAIKPINLLQIRYLESPCKYFHPVFFLFRSILKIKGSLLKKHCKRTEWQTWNFNKYVKYCFCCYVIKPAGEAVLLSVVWNLLLIEINLSQIRISDSKREKVCAVYPYLLFLNGKGVVWYIKKHQNFLPSSFLKTDSK